MGKITALKLQARNKDRVNVYLDDKFAFGLAKIEAARLRVGQELSEADIQRLQQADAHEKAYEKALNYLSYRPRSSAEVRKYLKGKELPADQIDTVLTRLQNAGLIDDTAFANYWVENRAAFRPKGKRALSAELRAKGLDRDAINAALEGTDEATTAQQLADARAPRLKNLPKQDFKRKLSDYLARRGFGYEIIMEVVERAWRVHGGNDDRSDFESETD